MFTKKFNGIIIGRFQPPHEGHIALIRQALSQFKKVVIVFEGDHASRSLRSPFTSRERMAMIQSTLSAEERSRLAYTGVRDYFYHPEFWASEVTQRVEEILGNQLRVIFGQEGNSSYPMRALLPDWDSVGTNRNYPHRSSAVRDALFKQQPVEKIAELPSEVKKWLKKEMLRSHAWRALLEEYKSVKRYRESWIQAPYPPVLTTTDCLVVHKNHILLIKRKNAPAQGLLALPGGFLESRETILQGAIRELKEETGIQVQTSDLLKRIKGSYVFDYPLRSARGRTITHSFFIYLAQDKRPNLRSDDDASEAFWMPFTDLFKRESEFCEDHLQMILHFLLPDPAIADQGR